MSQQEILNKLSQAVIDGEPEEAAELVIQNPDKREIMTIGSELGYGGAGHLSLVKVAWALRMEGIPREDIESVMWDNPKRIFNLPID